MGLGAGPGGGFVDHISAFKHRWQLSNEEEALLRPLSHKELSHIFEAFDGTQPLEELLTEAPEAFFDASRCALPEAPGLQVLPRLGRLELIDPTAVAVIFGDANLSFAVKLARHREALGHVGRVIATTFETLECLRERYQEMRG